MTLELMAEDRKLIVTRIPDAEYARLDMLAKAEQSSLRELAGNALLLLERDLDGNPKIRFMPTKTEGERRSFRVPETVQARLNRLAKRVGYTATTTLYTALIRYLENRKPYAEDDEE